MTKKPKIKKPGTVRKIIKSSIPEEPEKAEIDVEGADHLYREIRVENTLQDEEGKKVKLKQGAQVEVTIEADGKDTTPDDQDEEAKVFDLLTPEPSNLSLGHAETHPDRRRQFYRSKHR